MANISHQVGNHDIAQIADQQMLIDLTDSSTQFTYKFVNFFHPFVGELISRLNIDSLPGVFAGQIDPALTQHFFKTLYDPTGDNLVQVEYTPKEIDVSIGGPYANYNWELFFHIPLTIAVHLSKTQRFAEAQRWFHYLFDPTSNDQRFWKFIAFRNPDNTMTIDEIVRVLSTPRTELSGSDQSQQDSILQGYYAILNKPFQPHAIARTRPIAYQYCVVMKYLDNLIAWGDHLFQQDTIESINEATQIYVLAANVLGERPQRIPPHGSARAKTFAQLKKVGLGPIGDALVDLEGQVPFNVAVPSAGTGGGGTGNTNALFGIGRTLYFCIPRNDKLLGYWDSVADRLFKIRHCMSIAGAVRPLALFEPPIDPGMLVKAAAAGIDIGGIVNGLSQPIGPIRSLFLVQKALEFCNEVRSLGNALLSALEKRDAEHLALVRQCHEIEVQKKAQEVRFMQWKSAQEATTSLLTSRATALERLHYFQRQLGLPADQNAPDTLALDHTAKPDDPPKLNEENFDDVYATLVSQYDKVIGLQKLPQLNRAGDSSPEISSGLSGSGKLYLTRDEDSELNDLLPSARDATSSSTGFHSIAATLAPIPDPKVELAYWGLGGEIDFKVGTVLSTVSRITGDLAGITSSWQRDQAGMASRRGSFERRADDWLLQYNLAAHELMQIGRQILTSLIAEQFAHHEYLNIKKQAENADDLRCFLRYKFTHEDLYLWMQGEISRLYYEYYRLAFDTARRAERSMKQELMRPEVDARDFVKFNYWDGGRKGLLSGEALYLDVKQMEMAYHDNNKRELELIKHVSLRQLNPVALLTLKATGTCQVSIPEWLYDLDCPGHYMRRIKSAAISIPSVVGPYTSVNCTLSLLKSSLRKSNLAGDDYLRQGSEDNRFADYIGTIQSIVTSSGQNDSGMFETNLRDERFLPFEGAGAESTWKLDLPKDYRAFDYNTISDVILHIRYTARQGVEPTKVKAALDGLFQQANQAGPALLFSLRHEFPTEWSAFLNGASDAKFTTTIRKNYFPYFTQGKTITNIGLDFFRGAMKLNVTCDPSPVPDLTDSAPQFTITAATSLPRAADAEVFLIVRYTLG